MQRNISTCAEADPPIYQDVYARCKKATKFWCKIVLDLLLNIRSNENKHEVVRAMN